MIKESVTIDEVIEIMNEAIAIDQKAISNLINGRVMCNEKLAEHPTIQVRQGKNLAGGVIYSVGLLGILNGLFGIDDVSEYGAITAVLNDETGVVEKFIKTDFKAIQSST